MSDMDAFKSSMPVSPATPSQGIESDMFGMAVSILLLYVNKVIHAKLKSPFSLQSCFALFCKSLLFLDYKS